MSATALPRLLDVKTLAAELGVKTATAERIMRHCPKLTVGRRVYVTDSSVRDFLQKEARS